MRTLTNDLNIVVCVDSAYGIGKEGKIPWDIKEDMRSFAKITSGGICIMGRKTYLDMYNVITERAKKNNNTNIVTKDDFEILRGRTSFVVSNDRDFECIGATKVSSIRNAIESLKNDDRRKIYIIGGYRMFIEALPYTTKVYINIVKDAEYDCDVKFPIHLLNKKFKICGGEESELLYKMIYCRR